MDMGEKESQRLVSGQMEKKLTSLEEKAEALEKEFENILKRTSEIELWTKQYEAKVKEEKRLIGLLHTLVRPGDKRATALMNHLSVFFDEVLSRLAEKGIRYNNLKYLYRDFKQENVTAALNTVLKEMNFTQDEIRDIKLVIQLVHPRIRRTPKLVGAYELPQCSEHDPALVPQEINIFLQIRDELDEPMRTLLKKVVSMCYSDGKTTCDN